MFVKQLKLYFLIITIAGSIFLIYSFYKGYEFRKNQLDPKLVKQVEYQSRLLQSLAFQHYGVRQKIPVIIHDKMPAKLFGAATINKNREIKIYLNKKRFQESASYMIEDVLPHEYAHALMFVFGDLDQTNGGHTKRWQEICIKLEGKKCDRFVDHKDILIGKVPFLND